VKLPIHVAELWSLSAFTRQPTVTRPVGGHTPTSLPLAQGPRRMTAMSDQGEVEIVPFPPLPAPPLPPRFPPDPRQRARNLIVGAISSQLSEGGMQINFRSTR